LRRLHDGGIDAVLLDLALPDSKGWDTFDKTKAEAPAVPIIVLTGLGDEALALKMVQKGAQDYVAKMELNGGVLPRAILYAIERERTDRRIRGFNEDLELQVKARTAELQVANEELEAFSYSVSHDLRAPLRHINGFSEILLDTFGEHVPPDARNYLRRIQGSVQRMEVLIQDLLKLSNAGRQQLNLQTIALNQVVENVLADLTPDTKGRQIEWRIGLLPSLECDRGLMKQVFANLLGNSVKYTRAREATIIEVGQKAIEGRTAIFIRDNGAGFDLKYADKLFAPFQRLHAPEQFEGTGVGLAIVQRIIRKHGGRIWAEAEIDKGATFYFTLGS
jgi:light-regulated signal transduction histidine kinase (bacteriophytochrome)